MHARKSANKMDRAYTGELSPGTNAFLFTISFYGACVVPPSLRSVTAFACVENFSFSSFTCLSFCRYIWIYGCRNAIVRPQRFSQRGTLLSRDSCRQDTRLSHTPRSYLVNSVDFPGRDDGKYIEHSAHFPQTDRGCAHNSVCTATG